MVIGRGLRQAVTFIEILISIVLFAVALIPVFDLMGKGAGLTRETQESLSASHLAAEVVDQISCMPFRDIPVLSGFPLTDKENGALLVEGRWSSMLILGRLPDGFHRELTIESLSAYMKKITAKISWGTTPRHSLSYCGIREWTP